MNAKNETEKVCHAKNQALKSLARTNTEWKTFFPFLVWIGGKRFSEGGKRYVYLCNKYVEYVYFHENIFYIHMYMLDALNHFIYISMCSTIFLHLFFSYVRRGRKLRTSSQKSSQLSLNGFVYFVFLFINSFIQKREKKHTSQE